MKPQQRDFDVSAFLAAYDRLDAALVKAGWHPTSAWWRGEFERFLRSRRRRWVIRAGRRAGKSSFLCRLSVVWALVGPWSVPLGDVGVIAFFSLDRDEASGRIRTIHEILTTLGIEHTPTADEIALASRRCVFSVKTCSVRSVGFTAILVIADEMARWISKEDSANPSKEVAASYRPCMATQPFAFEVCSSSPWSTVDYHHELFTAGDNEHQMVSFAATWTANPTVSEADTHGFEDDPRAWAREFACIPQAELSAAFDSDDIESAFASVADGAFWPPVFLLDPARTGDTFAACIAQWCYPQPTIPAGLQCRVSRDYDPELGELVENRRYVRFVPGLDAMYIKGPDGETVWRKGVPASEEEVTIIEPEPTLCLYDFTAIDTRFGPEQTVKNVVRYAKSHGVRTGAGDQGEASLLLAGLPKSGIRYHSVPFTQQNKASAVTRIRRLMRGKQLALSPHETLRKQLHTYTEKLSNGRASYAGRGSGVGVDDFASLVVLAGIVEAEKLLPGSPIARRAHKSSVQVGDTY